MFALSKWEERSRGEWLVDWDILFTQIKKLQLWSLQVHSAKLWYLTSLWGTWCLLGQIKQSPVIVEHWVSAAFSMSWLKISHIVAKVTDKKNCHTIYQTCWLDLLFFTGHSFQVFSKASNGLPSLLSIISEKGEETRGQRQSGSRKLVFKTYSEFTKAVAQARKLKCCLKDLLFQPILLSSCYINIHCWLNLVKFKILVTIQWRTSCFKSTIKNRAKHPLDFLFSLSLWL